MDWSNVKLKYKLLSVIEVFQNWARFKSKHILNKIDKYYQDVLNGENTESDFFYISECIADLILNYGNEEIISNLNDFLKDTKKYQWTNTEEQAETAY